MIWILVSQSVIRNSICYASGVLRIHYHIPDIHSQQYLPSCRPGTRSNNSSRSPRPAWPPCSTTLSAIRSINRTEKQENWDACPQRQAALRLLGVFTKHCKMRSPLDISNKHSAKHCSASPHLVV